MTIEVHGTWDEKFDPVIETFKQSLAAGLDTGASFCGTIEGETVIDVWAGHADKEKTQPWEKDTIINVYSSTKTMASLVMLMLADRGEIDFYEKVTAYWPEFGQNGKEGIEVRHFMSHSAGLSGLDEEVTEDQIYDHDYICALLARQKPWWEPGSQSGYHALTQGYLQGEIVRRVTGKTLGAFFAEEVAGPLGADFFIGVPPEKDPQVITILPPEGSALATPEGDGIAARTFASPKVDATWAGHEGWRRAEIPAANGHGNARSVAEIHKILANGGKAKGRRFLSEEGVRRIFDVQTEGEDLVLKMPITFGMGFGLNSEAMPLSPNANTCFWGGWGGSLIAIDNDAHITGSYVMNQMAEGLIGDVRGGLLWGGFLGAALGQ